MAQNICAYACTRQPPVTASPSQVGVGQTLFAKRALWPVTGGEGHVITQRQQLGLDRVDQVSVVATWEVGAANAARKQHIAHKSVARGGLKKHHMAGRVAGAMQHLQLALANLHHIAIFEPLRGREHLGLRKAKHLRLFGQPINPELITRVRPHDGQAVRARQRAGGPGVVNVRVRQPDGFEVQLAFADGLLQHGDVTTWVNQRGVARFITPNQGAVLFKSSDGDGEALEHGWDEAENKGSNWEAMYRTSCC